MVEIEKRRLERIIRTIGRSDIGMSEAAATLTGQIKKTLSGASPSAPGTPPGQETGQYLSSWKAAVKRGEGSAFTTAAQGAALEYGTERMAARPHARPAALSFQEQYAAIIRKRLVEAL